MIRSALPLLLLMAAGCAGGRAEPPTVALATGTPEQTAAMNPADNDAFRAYWNQGKAELTRYALTQARYGELREGDAVLVFVTEDFLSEPQVKLESDPAGRAVTPVLKLNTMKQFITGIYPYSMMTSVFSPVAGGAALKVTTTSQEWCGHTFTQLNHRDAGYEVSAFSYFEQEGDQHFNLPSVVLEDELWTRIRLAPDALPTGKLTVVPGTMTARLRHIPLAATEATATLSDLDSAGTALRRFTLTYPSTSRTLSILFERAFPHAIVGWDETYPDGFGPQPKVLTTTARRTNRVMLDYWARHAVADLAWRDSLGLPRGNER